jgi:hypothetical protein
MGNNSKTNADVLAELRHYDELLRSTFFGMLSTIRHTDGLISTNPVDDPLKC